MESNNNQNVVNIYGSKGLKIERSKVTPTNPKLFTEIGHKKYIDAKGWNVNVNPNLPINDETRGVIKFSMDKMKRKLEMR